MHFQNNKFHKDDDMRWQFGIPSKGNARFAWRQHLIHFALQGMSDFVLANRSIASNSSGEGETSRAAIEASFADCMVALHSQLLYSTQIPGCLWFLTKTKADTKRGFHDRSQQTLFIDARKLGTLACKTRPRRTLKTTGALQVQKPCISAQTKGFSRLGASETAWRSEFV